ncbi:hypothetical protein BS47DRAFT_1343294 [Hydnum rufescens UP504]|uniref:Uncharacterized protein n=1 Tax=Hydnum rufescens UP504 TaxID=1448309 RepID=A0A9P6AY79_9AGAM|nr:hypothetical protein BS47DRAFT_1343294 [Hydnum rufescens UP504]
MVQLHLLHVYERVQPWTLYLVPRIGLGKILHISSPRPLFLALGTAESPLGRRTGVSIALGLVYAGAEMDIIGPLGEYQPYEKKTVDEEGLVMLYRTPWVM